MHLPTTSPYGYSSFQKEENGDTIDFLVSPIQDTIDYHLIQNSVERKLKLEINKRLNLRTLHLNNKINQRYHQHCFSYER